MDTTLLYSLFVGVGLIFVFLAVRIAVRWIVRLAIIALFILIAIGGAAWLLRDKSIRQPESKPRATPTRRASIDR